MGLHLISLAAVTILIVVSVVRAAVEIQCNIAASDPTACTKSLDQVGSYYQFTEGFPPDHVNLKRSESTVPENQLHFAIFHVAQDIMESDNKVFKITVSAKYDENSAIVALRVPAGFDTRYGTQNGDCPMARIGLALGRAGMLDKNGMFRGCDWDGNGKRWCNIRKYPFFRKLRRQKRICNAVSKLGCPGVRVIGCETGSASDAYEDKIFNFDSSDDFQVILVAIPKDDSTSPASFPSMQIQTVTIESEVTPDTDD